MSLFVTDKIRNERLLTCKSCKYYTKTNTCGPFAIGKEVIYNEEKRRLCGCIMPLKVKFKAQACPLGKWKSVLSKEDREALEDIYKEMESKRALTREEITRLYSVYNKAFDTFKDPAKVSPCCGGNTVKNVLNEIKQSIE